MLEDFYLPLVTEVVLFAAMAASFNFLVGFGRLFAIAQGAFASVGAYVAAVLVVHDGLSIYIGIPIAVVAGVILAAIVSLASFRVSDDYLAIATFALQIVVTSVLTNWQSVTGGATGISGIPMLPGAMGWKPLLVSLVVLGMVLESCRRVRYSAFGVMCQAMGEDPVSARALGKSVTRAKIALFAMSGGTAALAGAFYAMSLGFINPSVYDIQLSILLLSIVVIGGAGSILGPVAGAVIMIGVPGVLTQFGVTSSKVVYIREIVFAAVLVLVVAVLRRGIFRASDPSDAVLKRLKGARLPDPVAEGNAGSVAPGDSSRCNLAGEGISKSYGRIRALNDASVSIDIGRITGIVGPNGAGKTTMFEVLTGAVAPDEGVVRLGADEIGSWSVERRARSGVIRSFQDLRLFGELSVFGNAIIAAQRHHEESLVTALLFRRRGRHDLERAGFIALAALAQTGLGNDVARLASELSYAGQKSLNLARMVAAQPRVALLDEPVSGVADRDLESMSRVISSLAERGCAVCVIEHNTQVIASLADELVFMNLGQVVRKGSPQEIISDPELAELYFGVPRGDVLLEMGTEASEGGAR